MDLETIKKKSCQERNEPHVFRGSNRCVKCGRHRSPMNATGISPYPPLAVQI